MTKDEILDELQKHCELLGYNEAVADCIQIIISYLKRFEYHPDYRVIITMIGDDIVALKKTGE